MSCQVNACNVCVAWVSTDDAELSAKTLVLVVCLLSSFRQLIHRLRCKDHKVASFPNGSSKNSMVYCGIRALASLYKLCQLVAFSMHFSRPLMISFSSLLLDSTDGRNKVVL